jgi:spermidine synthase
MSPLTALYAIAIFLGSFLLFLVEPMAAKRLLPLLGGSASVWTTCLVFFQVALLLGYLCAHWLATRLRPRAQAFVYTGLLIACLAQASLNLRPDLHASTLHPIVSVFLLLITLIGLPFVVLSATSPLLQAWYSTGFSSAANSSAVSGSPAAAGVVPPYRLFALSNFGSLLALLIYPWLIEPRFSLREQSLGWLAGFVVFVTACAGIAWFKLRDGRNHAVAFDREAPAMPATAEEPKPSYAHRVLWLLLAACGSVMLCAMTNHLSQNIAAIPLLWIVPLTMYLLSFVVAFSRGSWLPGLLRLRIPTVGVSVARMILVGFTGVAIGFLVAFLDEAQRDLPLIAAVPLFCSALFVICLFCHAELHRLRPSPSHATSFYFLIAAGGALGAVFVGVLAPLIFSGSYELAWAVGFATSMVLVVTWPVNIGWRVFWSVATLAVAGLLIFFHIRGDGEHTVTRVRNFYGTLRVTEDMIAPFTGPTRYLYHGTIRHGSQIYTDELRKTPTTYYAHDSGVGLALDLCCGDRPRRVGVIGLGAGTLAAYGRPGDVFRFYDINPLVEPIARNMFSYIRESAATVEVVPGDARLSMAAEAPQQYDVLAIDAFSGDAIPVHLLTGQAMAVYQRHLAPGGIIAFHISNKFLSLGPVVHELAQSARLETVLVGSAPDDDKEFDNGEYTADWMLVTANQDFVAKDEVVKASGEIAVNASVRPWTDDYNSVLPLLNWKSRKEDDEDESPDDKKDEKKDEKATPPPK